MKITERQKGLLLFLLDEGETDIESLNGWHGFGPGVVSRVVGKGFACISNYANGPHLGLTDNGYELAENIVNEEL